MSQFPTYTLLSVMLGLLIFVLAFAFSNGPTHQTLECAEEATGFFDIQQDRHGTTAVDWDGLPNNTLTGIEAEEVQSAANQAVTLCEVHNNNVAAVQQAVPGIARLDPALDPFGS